MTTHLPQHLHQRADRRPVVVQARRSRLLVTSAALAVPASVGGMLAAAPAYAAAPAPAAAPTASAALASTPASAPAVLPAAPSSVVVLRYGATGDLVKQAQRRLGVTVDGAFGPRTLAAVRALQSRTGLQPDGVIGPLTWKALGGFPGSGSPDPTPSGCTSHLLRYGAKGHVVAVAQERLGIRADGDFGPITLDVVKAFQARKGLTVDGVIGPATWRALGGYPCGEQPPANPGGGFTGQDVLTIAKRYIGFPYTWGGASPEVSFDCSGLTQFVFRQVGVYIPRTSLEQSRFAPGIDLKELRVGDLVFFHTPVRHVAIYAGNGQIIDAAKPGTTISIHPMWVKPVKASRLLPR